MLFMLIRRADNLASLVFRRIYPDLHIFTNLWLVKDAFLLLLL